MRAHLYTNIILLVFLILLLIIINTMSLFQVFWYYYVTVLLFFCTHLLQKVGLLKIKDTESKFIFFYGLTNLIKLLLSCLFLVIYYLFLSKSSDFNDKAIFSTFFVLTYFLFLITNTRLLFNKPHGKNKEQKSS